MKNPLWGGVIDLVEGTKLSQEQIKWLFAHDAATSKNGRVSIDWDKANKEGWRSNFGTESTSKKKSTSGTSKSQSTTKIKKASDFNKMSRSERADYLGKLSHEIKNPYDLLSSHARDKAKTNKKLRKYIEDFDKGFDDQFRLTIKIGDPDGNVTDDDLNKYTNIIKRNKELQDKIKQLAKEEGLV